MLCVFVCVDVCVPITFYHIIAAHQHARTHARARVVMKNMRALCALIETRRQHNTAQRRRAHVHNVFTYYLRLQIL